MSKNIPEIRFKGFTREWDGIKLGDVFVQTSDYVNPKEDNIELFSLTVEKGLTQKTERYNRSFLVKKEDKFKKVNPDDFIYNPMNMTLGAVGFNDLGYSVAVSGYYVTMKTNTNWDNQYFRIWLSSPKAIHLYKLYATGSLIEKQRIQFPTFSQIKTKISSFKEQQKIGTFFKQLDDTIDLQQQLVKQQEQYKKAMLQKMFPQKGQSVPKVRLKGFSGNWYKFKLSSVIEKQIKGRAKLDKLSNGEVEYLDSNRLNGGEPFKSNGVQDVNVDDILVLWDGSKAGTLYKGFQGALGSTLKAYSINKANNSEFIYQQLIRNQEKIYNHYRTPNIPHVIKNFTDVFEIWIPSLDEQQKIGAFFKQLDNTIALHQKKLADYQQLKRALLQRMFV